ncbi:MAG: hypothetical protein D6806_16695 [Deltaproteobacteria bacterium]|nr:MAG: hypothetical protein D6806_16695 [Deltaproteobacteria bacterium]
MLLLVGPGGVGKTSLAAVLGLQASLYGRRVLVLTVDPAQRLADAVGLDRTPAGRSCRLSKRSLASAGLDMQYPPEIMMLDTGVSLSAAIRRLARSEKLRRAIVEHRFFDRMCRDLAGAREYAAVEEILHRHQSGRYDLVVVDTAPSGHALDLIDSPEKLLNLVEHRAWRFLTGPASAAGRLAGNGPAGGYLVRTLARFTGVDFLRQLAAFVGLFADMMEQIRARCAEMLDLLGRPSSSLVLVTLADPQTSARAMQIRHGLNSRGLEPALLLVNRVEPPPEPEGPLPQGLVERLELLIGERTSCTARETAETARYLLRRWQLQNELHVRDVKAIERLGRELGRQLPVHAVPALARDVHELKDLEQIRRHLFGPPPVHTGKGGLP